MLNQPATATAPSSLSPWLLLLAGLGVLYVPTLIELFQGPWSSDRNAHAFELSAFEPKPARQR